MKKLPALFVALFSLVWLTGAGWLPLAKSSGGGCSQATTFLARTSGLSGTETTAYTNLICGLVTDGIITGTLSGATGCGTVLDGLYIFATNTTTTANLNLCGTSFGLTTSAAPSFTADRGYTGNGTTQFLDTGFIPSAAGGATTLNSTSLGAYVLTNRTTGNTAVTIGAASGNFSYLSPLSSASNANTELNAATAFPNLPLPSNTAQGFLTVTRVSSTNITGYKNGSSTALANPADTSAALLGVSYWICADDNSGSFGSGSTDETSAIYFGAGVTGAQHLALSNRLNAYMTALGINVY